MGNVGAVPCARPFDLIIYNGQLIIDNYLSLAMGSGLLRAGCGFFETVLFKDNQLYFWSEHLVRLSNSLASFGKTVKIALPSCEFVENLLNNLQIGSICRVRLTVFPGDDDLKWDWLLSFQPYQQPNDSFSLKVVDEFADYSLLKHKSLNYWPNLLAIESEDSLTETARLNRYSNINEGCRSNILLLKDNELVYCGEENNYLKGITQQVLLNNYRAFGLKSVKPLTAGFSFVDLQSADQIWLVNSLMPVVAVKKIDFMGIKFEKAVDLDLVGRICRTIDDLALKK